MKFGNLQNLKNKILSLGDGEPEGLVLSAYGKLPLYKDFIQLASLDGHAADFRVWIDQSFAATFEEFGGKNVVLENPGRTVFLLDKGRRVAVAVIWPSSDEGGLRRFPFSFFTILNRKLLTDKGFAEGWNLLETIWGDLERHYERAKCMASIEEFYEAFQGATVSATPGVAVEASPPPPLSLPSFMEDISGEGGESEGETRRYAAGLTSILSTLISECKELTENGLDLAVRLPLGRGGGAASRIAIWFRVFQENLRTCEKWPGMIFPAGDLEHDSTLCLLWREGLQDDSLLFGPSDIEYDCVEDIAAEARSGGEGEEDGEFDLDMNVDDWIELLGSA